MAIISSTKINTYCIGDSEALVRTITDALTKYKSSKPKSIKTTSVVVYEGKDDSGWIVCSCKGMCKTKRCICKKSAVRCSYSCSCTRTGKCTNVRTDADLRCIDCDREMRPEAKADYGQCITCFDSNPPPTH